MEKEQIIERIQAYVYKEEANIHNEIIPQKVERKNVWEIDLDAIFWWPDEIENSDKSSDIETDFSKFEFEFWHKEKNTLQELLNQNKFSNEDFWLLKDAMSIIRWKYYMDETYETVDKDFQEMCSLFISLQLKKNDFWVNNFLRYFNPDTAYYKRVKALTLFRLQNNPTAQIESVRNEVCELLYNSTQCEDWDYKKSENILKEYIERVFSITRTTYDSRIEFISEWGNSWDTWCGNNDFVDWLWKYINWEKIDSEIAIIDEDTHDNEEIENLRSKLKEKEDEAEQIRKEQEAILQRQKELEDKLNKVQVSYNEDLKKKELENAELQAKILLLQQANEISKKSETKEEITVSTEDLEEKRSHYRILVVWWSDKANKKYNYLLKNWFNWELYNRFKINPEQLWELYGDYNKQKTQKDFARKIENDLLLWNIDFVVALQTDHETWLYKLLNNSEFWSRITYFAEREENNQNPKYSDQSFSEERFYYYLERAIEKFERAENNSIA